MRSVFLAVGGAVLAFSLTASASVITFSGAPVGPGFTGPVSEAGYTYSLYSGNLYINTDGNPGNNVEPDVAAGTGGTLAVVATGGSLFDFNGIDVGSAAAGSITVTGYDGSTLVGTDTFAGADTGLPGSYTTYTVGNMNDVTEILIGLPSAPETAIDNVVVNAAAATPEPSSIALLGTGLMGFAGVIKRRLS